MFPDCECLLVQRGEVECCAVHGTTRRTVPVWVLLDELWGEYAKGPRSVGDGFELRGRARGWLYEWQRSATGGWIGVVDYLLDYADGRSHRHTVQRQWVPAHVLQPRE